MPAHGSRSPSIGAHGSASPLPLVAGGDQDFGGGPPAPLRNRGPGAGSGAGHAASVVVTVRVWSPKLAMRSSFHAEHQEQLMLVLGLAFKRRSEALPWAPMLGLRLP